VHQHYFLFLTTIVESLTSSKKMKLHKLTLGEGEDYLTVLEALQCAPSLITDEELREADPGP
jgi:hypothetical protein